MSDIEMVKKEVEAIHPKVVALTTEIKKKIVGQERMINRVLISLFSNGHVLLEGVPGLAKSTLVETMADALGVKFNRIQFTPDLLPSDIIGTMIYDPKTLQFMTKKGPVFTNVLLADEINRSPSKVQAALLESMQERQVSLGDTTHKLDKPFLVLATQNPLEQEGTYRLPEAQLDRFIMKIILDYPTKEEERKIVKIVDQMDDIEVNAVFSAEDIINAQKVAKDVYIADELINYVVDVIDATRFPAKSGLDSIANYIECGASPRASISLIKASRVNALLKGRAYVMPDDIKALAHDILRHRVILTYEAEAEGVTVEEVISEILDKVEVP